MRSASRERHHVRSLQPDLVRRNRLKEPQTTPQEDGHHVKVQFVNDAGIEALLHRRRAADNGHIFTASRRFRLLHDLFNAVYHEGET